MKSLNKKVIKNFSWAVLGRIFSAIFQTIGIVLLARWESIENFGIVVSIIAFSAVLSSFIDFGFTTYLIKERAKFKNSDKIYSCIRFNAVIANISSVIAAIVIISFGWFFNYFYFYIIPLAFWLAYERRSDQLLGVFIADGNNKKATQLLTIRRLSALIIFMLIYLVFDINPTLSFTLGYSISSILLYYYTSNVIQLDYLLKKTYSFKFMFSQTFPYWINSLFAQLRNIDVIIVSTISGTVQGAYFGFVNRAISPLNMIATSMSSVILPSVAKQEIIKKDFFKYIIFIALLTSFPYIILFFSADTLIPLVLGEKYFPTIELIKIISLGLVFYSTSSIIGSILQGVDMQKEVASVNMTVTIFYIIILIPLTFIGGSLYSIYALLIFFLLRFLLMIYFLIKHTRKLNE